MADSPNVNQLSQSGHPYPIDAQQILLQVNQICESYVNFEIS